MLTLLFLMACGESLDDTGTECLERYNCDGDHIAQPFDCDDTDPDYDASQPVAYYPDVDGDGVGEYPGEGFCEAPGEGWVITGGDCDDTDPDVVDWPC